MLSSERTTESLLSDGKQWAEKSALPPNSNLDVRRLKEGLTKRENYDII
jgi:hypothetical protein